MEGPHQGTGAVIAKVLEDDSVPASALAAVVALGGMRPFERLEGVGAVPEFSGRTSFRICGL
ncbi:MAG: hypothetical protein BGO05_00855 [Rhizobiales bacterium 63-7]|nr:MAG: hypothetical protein BGO05_00855 [Rhizobiales bacterium 63-7]